jgi:hypothetical protein
MTETGEFHIYDIKCKKMNAMGANATFHIDDKKI